MDAVNEERGTVEFPRTFRVPLRHETRRHQDHPAPSEMKERPVGLSVCLRCRRVDPVFCEPTDDGYRLDAGLP